MTLQAAKNTGVLGSRNNVFGIWDISRKSTSLPHAFREFFSEFWLLKISQAQGAALGQKSGYGLARQHRGLRDRSTILLREEKSSIRETKSSQHANTEKRISGPDA